MHTHVRICALGLYGSFPTRAHGVPGQVKDLLHVLDGHGMPSPTLSYLFNGEGWWRCQCVKPPWAPHGR